MQFLDFMMVPTVLFMVVVMPLWLVMHYRAKGKTSRHPLALFRLGRWLE